MWEWKSPIEVKEKDDVALKKMTSYESWRAIGYNEWSISDIKIKFEFVLLLSIFPKDI